MIVAEENKKKQLERLGAQRQVYATGKLIFWVQILLSVPLAILSSIVAIKYPSSQSYVALWGIIISVCDLAWFTPWQDRLRDTAAAIQEVFDCDVLKLPWNALKGGKLPDPELVACQSKKYAKWAHKMPKITDWYSVEVDRLPLYVGRIACQRTNCWWDAEQRRKYVTGIIVGTSVVFGALFLISFIGGLTLQKFTLNVAAPFIPALLLGIRQYQEHTATALRLDRLKDYAVEIWNKACNGDDEEVVTVMSRNLQDEILENRRRKPFVFDSIYKRLQPEFESNMNYGVAELVEEWERRRSV